ncbi:MAG: pilus assembly protein PilM [Myxococcota bacterium]|nr:pilus assembly protein PilM [Myxococcota bacterium]
MTKTVLGLDLGTYALKAVELRQGLRGLEFVQSQIAARAAEEAGLSEAIRQFAESHTLNTDHVACAISGQRIAHRRLEFPFRDRKKLAQAIPFEIEGSMPFNLDDLIVDWQLLPGESSLGVVAASAAQKEDIGVFLGEVDDADCCPRVLEAEGMVLGNLAALYDLPGHCLMVDIGHEKTTFCLCVDGQPVAGRTAPVGGKALTKAIAQDAGVDLDEAERIKHGNDLLGSESGGAGPAAAAVLERIAREFIRSLESLDPTGASLLDRQTCKLVLMGGTAKLEGIVPFLGTQTGLSPELIAPPEDPANAALTEGYDLVLSGPALALALRSTGQSLTALNFRKNEFAYRSSYAWLVGSELRPTLALVGVCVLLLVAVGITSVRLEASRAQQLERQMSSRYAAIFPNKPPPSLPMAALAQDVSSARERANFLGLYGGNLSALDLLTLLSERIPAELTLKFDEINIDQNVIRIKVAAQNYEAQDRLENVLKAEPVFAQADVTGSAKRLKDGSVTFGLSIPLNQAEDEI